MPNDPNEAYQDGSVPPLDYDPSSLPRELKRHYVSASEKDLSEMLEVVGVANIDELFEQVPQDIRFAEPLDLPEELSYEGLQEHLADIASKNRCFTSFLGDGIPDWKVHPITSHVCGIRP
ncbi:MAG: hypothetical protein VCA36_03350, partial [Opitutales bacterium]